MTILGVAGRDDIEAMQRFVDEFDLAFISHAVDEDGSLWRHFEVFGQPTWVFLDSSGSYERVFGGFGERQLTQRLEALASS